MAMKVLVTRERYHQLVQHLGAEFQRAWQVHQAGQAQQDLLVGEPGGQCAVELDCVRLVARWQRVERLAGEWLALAWQTQVPLPNDGRLGRWAENVVAQVRYLSEPLRLWELDQIEPAAVVRSTEVVPTADGREYFELVGRPAGGELRRYQVSADGQRQPVGFRLVHDTLFRLLADLAIAASQEH
jgi:hypothetical protein